MRLGSEGLDEVLRRTSHHLVSERCDGECRACAAAVTELLRRTRARTRVGVRLRLRVGVRVRVRVKGKGQGLGWVLLRT